MGKQIVIAGYYGFGNVGDEAILASMLHDLRELCPDASFVVLSENPQQTASAYEVKAVLWRDLDSVIAAIENSSLLIVGGGGLFNSYLEYEPDLFLVPGHSLFSVFIFSLPFLARLLQKPCMIYGVGVSYINNDDARRHVQLAFKYADMSSVRDHGSRKFLKALGCAVENIRVTADPAFRLVNSDLNRIQNILHVEGVHYPVVGVALRNWTFSADPRDWEPEVAAGLGEFARESNSSVVFIPFQQSQDAPQDLSNDLTIIQRIRAQLGEDVVASVLKGSYSPAEISGVIAFCNVALCMRLHSVILAIKNAVPFIALSYDPKVMNMLKMVGMEDYAIELSTLSASKLSSMLQKVHKDREKIRAHLAAVTTQMSAKALENVHLTAELLEAQGLNPDGIWIDHETNAFLREFALKQTKLLASSSGKGLVYRQALRHLVQKQQFDSVLDLMGYLLEQEPHNAEWHYLAGFCLHMTKRDAQKALQHYDLSLQYGFDEFWVRYNRGVLCTQLGQSEQALEDLKRAVTLNPTHTGAQHVLQHLHSARNVIK